jgi:hypothetical protein
MNFDDFSQSPAPSYTWKRMGTGEKMPNGFTLRKENRVLHIPNAQVADSGEYECTASNSQGAVSAVLPLDIHVKPQFMVPLSPQLVDAGKDVTWTCAAFGRPAVTYRWFKNGDPLDYRRMKTPDIGRFQIDGARLFVRAVQETDNGVFQCQAENVLGTALSSGELRVLSLAPTFRKHPVDAVLYAAIGGNVTIFCQPEAAPAPVIRWIYNEATLLTSSRIRILGTGDLFISPVSLTDQGWYT